MAQFYGGYVIPGSTLEDLHLTVGQWNTEEGRPYRVMQHRVRGFAAWTQLRRGNRTRGIPDPLLSAGTGYDFGSGGPSFLSETPHPSAEPAVPLLPRRSDGFAHGLGDQTGQQG
ncbi:hypothetical protein [Nocardiopsis xinjiangensis]|uniref:hypothetical protein n=1 Tax=Nocardiopsis xinjiangensis TaxID=124285 RepID=UPI001872FB08|nr:hypothetical protein [Nocardiopsis xinjiangensis]